MYVAETTIVRSHNSLSVWDDNARYYWPIQHWHSVPAQGKTDTASVPSCTSDLLAIQICFDWLI